MSRLAACVAVLCLAGCYRSHELGGPGAPDASPADLCTSTGGHVVSGCCDWHCGDVCMLRCVRDVCACPGVDEAWDDARGCVVSPMCHPVHSG